MKPVASRSSTYTLSVYASGERLESPLNSRLQTSKISRSSLRPLLGAQLPEFCFLAAFSLLLHMRASLAAGNLDSHAVAAVTSGALAKATQHPVPRLTPCCPRCAPFRLSQALPPPYLCRVPNLKTPASATQSQNVRELLRPFPYKPLQAIALLHLLLRPPRNFRVQISPLCYVPLRHSPSSGMRPRYCRLGRRDAKPPFPT